MSARNLEKARAPRRARTYDVAIVGGGPAGAMTAWSLATRGLRVVVLDREEFPREKVCGDFVEPRGLRLMDAMGAAVSVQATNPLPITHVAIYIRSRIAYSKAIPFYGLQQGLPPHGFIVPRDQLDIRLLEAAQRAGAEIRQGCPVAGFRYLPDAVEVSVQSHGPPGSVRARTIVGADGVSSLVARQAGLWHEDSRHTAVSQRTYVENLEVACGEATFMFDKDLYPGYGWMFPMRDGTANVGVGILSEARQRYGISVPQLFQGFMDKLRKSHSGSHAMRVAGRTLGGIVRTYGGAGRNYFERGLLVGDAGCFVDPMTGEGITPALESALIASGVLAHALETGRTSVRGLAVYERAFRSYFDPAMQYLELCAAVMRNRHLSEFWLAIVAEGCKHAESDVDFARVSGATFGGLDVSPIQIFAQLWIKLLQALGRDVLSALTGPLATGTPLSPKLLGLLQEGWLRSMIDDPLWHLRWASDVASKWSAATLSLRFEHDPRLYGPPLPSKPTLRAGASHWSAQ